ncbi:MAG: deoxyribodipyrimidine photo-lyase [Candidatus Hydrogenedentes bacterium]|nr:deoxyribodipyrimidine photo-lyase [Candidatus Hydrogenedentota bacterium]
MPHSSVLYWIRNDLRLADNPALTAAIASGQPVIPVFIWSPEEEGNWPPGAATRAWLERSLAALAAAYETCGSRLILRQGSTCDILLSLCDECGADTVVASRRYEPSALRQEADVRDALRESGRSIKVFNGSLLNAPNDVATQMGEPYKVFTPYYNACLKREPLAVPYPAPERIPAPVKWPATETLESLTLTPEHPWVGKMLRHWQIGEAGAQARLAAWVDEPVTGYPVNRDLPGISGTSTLSPYLHFGEISPRQIAHAVRQYPVHRDESVNANESYIRQLYWREFAHHLLYHFPHTPEEPLKELFGRFPWVKNDAYLKRWQRGQTGYPFVDAGMRELWETGWMHNRVRMVVASFLIKDLRIHWREGADWFWDTLFDADLPNNSLGWQWVAGCGADAAPYFRVFNPVTQGMKFDGAGEYVRKWVPELAALPDKYIHCPWELGPIELASHGVTLGNNYPHPMVNHDEARKTALAIYDELKSLGE